MDLQDLRAALAAHDERGRQHELEWQEHAKIRRALVALIEAREQEEVESEARRRRAIIRAMNTTGAIAAIASAASWARDNTAYAIIGGAAVVTVGTAALAGITQLADGGAPARPSPPAYASTPPAAAIPPTQTPTPTPTPTEIPTPTVPVVPPALTPTPTPIPTPPALDLPVETPRAPKVERAKPQKPKPPKLKPPAVDEEPAAKPGKRCGVQLNLGALGDIALLCPKG